MDVLVLQDSCVPSVPSPTELVESFEGKLSHLWQVTSGEQTVVGCGTISKGKALYFGGLGRREARTVPLDTTHTRLVHQKYIYTSNTYESTIMMLVLMLIYSLLASCCFGLYPFLVYKL